MGKVYNFKGLSFRIGLTGTKAFEDVPSFTSEEWAWIKRQNLGHDEFKVLVLGRVEDPHSPIIPEEELKEPARLARKYGPAILQMLRGIAPPHEGKPDGEKEDHQARAEKTPDEKSDPPGSRGSGAGTTWIDHSLPGERDP